MQYLSQNPNGKYYIRLRVPSDISKVLKRNEILVSLRTTCLNKAKIRCHILAGNIIRLFKIVRDNEMSWQEFRSKLDSIFNQMLSEEQELIHERGPKSSHRLGYLADLSMDFSDLSEIAREKPIKFDEFLPFFNASPNQEYLLKRLIKEFKRLDLSTATPMQYAEIMNMLSHFYNQAIELHCKAKKYNNSQNGLAIDDLVSPMGEQSIEITTIELKDALDLYVSEKDNADNWGEKTKMETISVVSKFIELFGNVPVGTLNRVQAREFKNILLKLPPNLSTIRNRDFGNRSLFEISQVDHAKKISPKTVNKMISFIRGFIRWCVDNGYINENVFQGIKAIEPKRRARDERDHFEPEEIVLILETIKAAKYDWQKWSVLVAAYSGVRLNEICQLYKDGIIKIEDIWCMRIDEHHDDQKVKNLNSHRIVPIHKKLLEMGFLEYVDSVEGDRLFPVFKRSINGYGDKVSKWFNRTFLKNLNLKTPKKTYHSLRHTFINELKKNEVDVNITESITGHTTKSMAYGRYGGDYKMTTLRNTVNTVEYSL